ncbi:MAG: hypothetical protein SGJ19_01070 [Planctomycetia bacterium]|nr:hypothetical protein [Planctomycetia bacterium]
MIGVIEHPNWQIEFFRCHDRVGHRILWGPPDAQTLLAESLEGTPDQTWPASPPFQHVHFEARENGANVALLVGMAGKSHWSSSVEIRPEAGGPTWDVACRTSDVPEWLGMSYRLAVPTRVVGDQIWFNVEGEVVATALSFDVDARIQAEVTGGNLRWRVAAPAVSQPRTFRWRYSFISTVADEEPTDEGLTDDGQATEA